jgi:hypothetical protein
LVLQLERLIYRIQGEAAVDQIEEAQLACRRYALNDVSDPFDVIVDLAGQGNRTVVADWVLTPLFNSLPGEAGAMAALMQDCPLRIDVHVSGTPAKLLSARPAITDGPVLTRALDNVLSCAAELIVKTVAAHAGAEVANSVGPPSLAAAPTAPSFSMALAHITGDFAWKLGALLGKLAQGGHTWASAWRLDNGAPLVENGEARFSIVPSDRRRYYADPFPYYHGGQYCVFVEEYQLATQRGCISVATINGDGSISAPRAIIEETYHLSYPFVFGYEGEIWMIPESGAARRIDLYRAESFPYRWKREGALLDGIPGYDATIYRQGGRLWLFVSLGRWRSSTWDTLSIFYSEKLTGPWIPHVMNPVLLDSTVSRPGGALFQLNGETIRPAQDCSQIYGGAISICRLDCLSDVAFGQTSVGRIVVEGLGCHTYNRHARLEVLDVFGATHDLTDVTAHYVSFARRCAPPRLQGP